MDRTETVVIEVDPEKRQTEIRMRQEFGWTLTTGQEDTVMRDRTTHRKAKLLFSRSGSQSNLDELKKLETELEKLRSSVTFDDKGLVLAEGGPTESIPYPLVAAAALVTGGLSTAVLPFWVGLPLGLAAGGGAFAFYRKKLEQAQAEYHKRCLAATDVFRKKQAAIIQQARVVKGNPQA